jgi:hypothetical protein
VQGAGEGGWVGGSEGRLATERRPRQAEEAVHEKEREVCRG